MKHLFYSLAILLTCSLGFAQRDVVAVVGKTPQKIEAKNLQFLSSSTYRLQNELTSLNENVLQSNRIAALAFNQNSTQLVFMTLDNGNIFAYDLQNQTLSTLKKGEPFAQCSVGMQFARMTLAPNGNIYAINNNATSVLEISQHNGSYRVKDLGYLTDVSSKGKSLLERYEGWGGDMVADVNGDLYIISASGRVFLVSLENMTSSYIGEIKNLEKGFSTNGAAVDNQGNVILGNSQGKGFYAVNMDNLNAKKIGEGNAPIYDLASAYFLHNDASNSEIKNNNLSLYPTKVKERQITLSSINKNLKGKGKVVVLDINGQVSLEKDVVFNQNKINISLQNLPNVGFYIVKVLDQNNNEIHNEKIMVLR